MQPSSVDLKNKESQKWNFAYKNVFFLAVLIFCGSFKKILVNFNI